MKKFRVYLQTWASTSVEVEAEDKEAALTAYFDDMNVALPTLCAQCSGWGQDYNLDLNDQWNPAVSPGEPETNAVEEISDGE